MKSQTDIVLSKNKLTLMVRMNGSGLAYTFTNTVIPYGDVRKQRRLMIKQLSKKANEAPQK